MSEFDPQRLSSAMQTIFEELGGEGSADQVLEAAVYQGGIERLPPGEEKSALDMGMSEELWLETLANVAFYLQTSDKENARVYLMLCVLMARASLQGSQIRELEMIAGQALDDNVMAHHKARFFQAVALCCVVGFIILKLWT